MNAPLSYHIQCLASGCKLRQHSPIQKSIICNSCECFTRAGFVPCVYKGLCHESQTLTLPPYMVIQSLAN